MLHGPLFPIFQTQLTGSDDTTPGATSWGTSVAAGTPADTYGSYVEVLADTTLTQDAYALSISIASNSGSGAARFALVTIGKDETGGTSYTDWIVDLVAGATDTATAGHRNYYFPLYVKAGTSLAAKHRNSTASQAVRVSIVAHCAPKYPHMVWCGQKVKTFTFPTLTLGTTSDGAWTASSTSIDAPYWWWQFGAHFNDTTMSANLQSFDMALGDASNKRIIFEDHVLETGSTEACGHSTILLPPPIRAATLSDILYVRGQCSGTADASCQSKAYGVL